ncbi:WXG100 family type VII secretion target [Salinispora arenicola]|uniref:WXG100 family type VII secretion target n=1 Tax=Salinispora arenicola TaxID=168697 RepID=A0A542XHJ6_SALAC|nr:WXG100 family type VII secretion target [Salinispora arenicola]TQL35291.1 WXG100 family type VII secretion target [Salinispora arenicola]GIM87868.1 hypothetical protein Sar04_46040 [Salinispora arenicola]
MAQYTIDFSAARATVAHMQDAQRRIQDSLRTLDEHSRKSLQRWDSDAKVAYAQCKHDWDQAAAQMPVLLGQATRALDAIMAQYAGAERAGASMWER